MNAKVADFGPTKLLDCSKTHASTSIKDTLGYLDPEYYGTSSLTEKSDVCSFGVVFLEIKTGTPPSENIVALARELLSCGRIVELMDSSLCGFYKLSAAWKVAEVAYICVAPKSIGRPMMRMVVKDLEEAVTLEFHDSTRYEHISTGTFDEPDMSSAR
ncbi:hypothetical protein SUGI_1524650 [Cryptomeria japonica]|uniref:Protein kinase domain-containing protein n=1 Tax=Cryptomeria japonica TaxID=3369 RepID=A0AAD3RS20_CRYJA|nr:hypothetical protein SUGI_1524650 [Cryptomeria japonica]